MGAADVVGGQCKPGVIRLSNAVRHPLTQILEVLGTAKDTLLRIGALFDPHRTGGILGQHHHPTDTGRRNRFGVPV